jgi:hypothetical protein
MRASGASKKRRIRFTRENLKKGAYRIIAILIVLSFLSALIYTILFGTAPV